MVKRLHQRPVRSKLHYARPPTWDLSLLQCFGVCQNNHVFDSHTTNMDSFLSQTRYFNHYSHDVSFGVSFRGGDPPDKCTNFCTRTLKKMYTDAEKNVHGIFRILNTSKT